MVKSRSSVNSVALWLTAVNLIFPDLPPQSRPGHTQSFSRIAFVPPQKHQNLLNIPFFYFRQRLPL